MEKKVYVINKSNIEFSRIDIDLKKQIILKPQIPVPLPYHIAMKYVNFKNIHLCSDPEKYFKDRFLKHLIIRDAGLGDLLLLEPIIRQLKLNGNKHISVLSRYPEIYDNNPYIDDNLKMREKDTVSVNLANWDIYDDLRNYSETCQNRDIKHRTDCYNQVFNINIEDKEPRLYFKKDNNFNFKKKKNKIYIGIACDGSHGFRRYAKGLELINYLLEKNSDYVLVILGDWEYVENIPKNKRILNLQEKTTIKEVINIIKNLDYMIASDSGLMHIALTMHIPTVCIFSIIKPELRLDYYKGLFAIVYKDSLECIGCGSKHMVTCKHIKNVRDNKYFAPCLDISVEEIYNKLKIIQSVDIQEKRIFYSDNTIKEKEEKKVTIIHGNKKLIMPIIVLNEERNLPRFIELVMSHPAIEKTIAIDGGSNDKTVDILKKAGAFVYMNYYNNDYHDMQALQRNVSCSFIQDGQKIIIMDIDECFSKELSDHLFELAERDIEYGLISRRTFNYYDDINDPDKQIKDYPDWQPRFFTWNRRFKWVGSPHHNIYNTSTPVKIQKDIIHFEKENKDREALEIKWSKMHKATKEIYV